MAQTSAWLPKISHLAGKAITSTGVRLKEIARDVARDTSHLAGECTREFVDGLKEGKSTKLVAPPVTVSDSAADRIARAMHACTQRRGDTDGDLERVMHARKLGFSTDDDL